MKTIKIKPDTLRFKSDPLYFFKEQDGVKPCTVRKDDPDDSYWEQDRLWIISWKPEEIE